MIKSYILFVFFFISAILSAQESINYAVVKDIPYRTIGDPYGLERCKLDVYYPENGKTSGRLFGSTVVVYPVEVSLFRKS
jgi:alpha/beta hydrolase fold-3 domain-containing protein